jgi:hypothetical protein
MSFRTQADQGRAIEAAHVEGERRKTIAQVYQKYQQLVHCEANERKTIEVIERFIGPDVVPTFSLFEDALAENPDEMKNFAQQPVEHTKEQITQEILTLLASKNGGRDGKFDAYNLRSEESRMKSWSLDALRARLNEIKTKQKMAVAPVSVLKTYVAESRRDTSPYPGFPQMPKEVWQDGKTVPLNAATIKAMSSYEIRRLARIYSDRQLNDRLAQQG